jgi:RNA polymerase sigma factor (sigma-70 family)
MPFVSTEDAPSELSTLVDRCLGGDRQAWTEIIDRYERLIYSVARAHLRASALADDVFQEVCLELYRRLDTLRDPQALPAWLITITRRKAVRALDERSDWSGPDLAEAAATDAALASFERRFWLEEAMAGLPERCRLLVELLYFDPDQPTYAEVAQRLGMPADSIGPTRARCLGKLRALCGPRS